MALELTEAVKASPSAVVEPATIPDALATIRAWRALLQAVAGVAEAQVMAACWVIQRDAADRGAFDEAVRRIPGLPPDRAWAMAETWAVARRQRAVRTLALDAPAEAVRFVSELASAVDTGELTDDDREVAELLAAPPRQRRLQLVAMVRMRRGADQAPPEPSTEPDSPPEPPRQPPTRLLARMEELERTAAELARDIAASDMDVHWTTHARDRLNILLERCIAHIEGCAAAEDPE